MAAEQLPINFAIPGENVTVSYDYTDFSEGTGIVVFYGGAMKDSSAEFHRLDRNAFEPWHEGTSAASGGTNTTGRNVKGTVTGINTDPYTKLFDLDFDTTEMNLPKTLKGTMLVNIPFGTSIADSGSIPSTYCVVTLKKVDVAAAETTIATATSHTQTLAGGAGIQINNGMFAFTISVPKTLIKKGEKIRITLEAYLKANQGSSKEVGLIIGYDPQGRAAPQIEAAGSVMEKLEIISGGTIMKYFIPFDIEQ